MGQVMTFIDAVRDLDSLDEESTLYVAEPWTENSNVIVANEPISGGLPMEAQKLKLKYFLEVFVARDFLEDWEANQDPKPNLHEKCARIIQFAITDA